MICTPSDAGIGEASQRFELDAMVCRVLFQAIGSMLIDARKLFLQ
jgi:tRNA A-37 threonylcarbamoyl transferase component Bud32